MRKIFVDCGTHFGQGIKSFRKRYRMDNSWEIFTWEANPYTYKKFLDSDLYKNVKITAFNSAVASYDGTITLNLETIKNKNEDTVSNTGQGSSVIPTDSWVTGNQKHAGVFLEKIEVPCVDISKWITDNCSPSDFVLIKLDVEGAEYQILEKMLEGNTARLINAIYIEWHSRFFSNSDDYIRKEKKIIDKLITFDIKVGAWI